MTNSTKTLKAIWTPSWYELDQSLAIAANQKFWFFQHAPQSDFHGEPVDLVFFNQLDSDCNTEVRFAEVVEIHHPVLGPLTRVDTDGLDYIFTPILGDPVLVNAEEEPGKAYELDEDIDDWSVLVTLQHVSDPMCDVV